MTYEDMIKNMTTADLFQQIKLLVVRRSEYAHDKKIVQDCNDKLAIIQKYYHRKF